MLAQAGHDVTLIGRAQHVEAVGRHGLLLEKRGVKTHVPMRASTEPDEVRHARLVLFCVKSVDTESAGLAMAPHLKPETAVLSLQNGVDDAERLQTLLKRIVIPAIVYVGAEMAGPGHVRHHGRGELVVGAAPDSMDFAAMFAQASIPTEVFGNAIGTLWAKMILNCAYNALSAIARQPYGQLVAAAGVAAVIKDVVEECLAVARRMRVTIPSDIWCAVEQIAETMPEQYFSTAQDLARGKPSEIDLSERLCRAER
jgi:2-dehydropantoate 2-reductase